ncbi:MAG: hypothetical protein RL637_291 [Pseudomonadota bacterium]|jgi:cation:H+ antiporter
MIIHVFTLLAALTAVIFAAHRAVMGAASVARHLNVSPLLIGLTIVSLGTSIPEIFIATLAAQAGNPDLALGNIIGSNIANIALVLGATAVIMPLTFQSKLLKRELPLLFIFALLNYCVAFDGVGRGDSVFMLIILILFMIWQIRTAFTEEFDGEFEKELKTSLPDTLPLNKAGIYLAIGLMVLVISAKLLVWSATNIAHLLGVEEWIIGLTVVAITSSLPELVIAISSVLRKEDDLAIGNMIGSSIYNLLLAYPLTGIIAPEKLLTIALRRDFPIMLGFIAILFFLGRGLGFSQGVINRWQGGILLLAYISYLWSIYQSVIIL